MRLDDGRYEILEPGATAPITIKDTQDKAIEWVKKMEAAFKADTPDQSLYHSPDDAH